MRRGGGAACASPRTLDRTFAVPAARRGSCETRSGAPGSRGERAERASHHQDRARCFLSIRSGRRHSRVGTSGRSLDGLDAGRGDRRQCGGTARSGAAPRGASPAAKKDDQRRIGRFRRHPVRGERDAQGWPRIPGGSVGYCSSPRRQLRSQQLPQGHHTKASRRGAVDPGAEDGSGRPAHRRHRARIQQHAHRDHGDDRDPRRRRQGQPASCGHREAHWRGGRPRRATDVKPARFRQEATAAAGRDRRQRSHRRSGPAAVADLRQAHQHRDRSSRRCLAGPDRPGAVEFGAGRPCPQRPRCDGRQRHADLHDEESGVRGP